MLNKWTIGLIYLRTGAVTVPGCVPAYDVRSDRSSPDGVRQDGVITLDMCKAACIAVSNCVALDFDNTQATPACWIHNNAANLAEQRDTARITQYFITDRCPAGTVSSC